MRTTVKLDLSRSLVIEPAATGVMLTLKVAGVTFDHFHVTPDQAGAAIFGMEQALEAGELQRALYAAKYEAKGDASPARWCNRQAAAVPECDRCDGMCDPVHPASGAELAHA